jgi:hypothetical protein
MLGIPFAVISEEHFNRLENGMYVEVEEHVVKVEPAS